MATIDERKDKKGKVTGYRFRACVGRDDQYNQVWRTVTIPRPEGLTPAKERKEVERRADEWEAEQKAEYERTHSKTDRDRITLSDFIKNHWWPDYVMDGTHTPNSIQFYQYMSDDIIDYFGQKKRLKSIDGECVKRYVKYLNTEAKTKQGKPYSASTIQHHYKCLRNIFEYARRFRYIVYNPCDDLSQKEKPHRAAKKIDFLDVEDAREFLNCLDSEPLFWRAFVNVLITCGLRRGECIGLQWRDIDPVKLTLTIERNVTIDKYSEEKYSVGSTKTGESRTVPLSPRIYAMLMELKQEQEDRLQTVIMPGCYIFSRQADPLKPIYPTEPTRFMRKFVARHNLPDVSPHDLRHTAATLALEAGANLKEVQELLGHADPATTMEFYTGVTEEAQRRTVEGIEKLIV